MPTTAECTSRHSLYWTRAVIGIDFDQGGFGGVILAIRRLNRGEEVVSDGMVSESGINGALEKFT